MLVLDGNNPRFPWEPSTTMLTYRLNGTTERKRRLTGADPISLALPIFARHGEPQRGSTLLTSTNEHDPRPVAQGREHRFPTSLQSS